MTHPKAVIKSVGPLLVPFFKSVAVFFVVFPQSGTLWYLLFKCVPICCLIGFVVVHGMNLSEVYSYSRRILLGLIFSLLGDALLCFDNYFLLGMVMFAIAHMLYISSFGFRPLGLGSGAVCATIGSIIFFNVFPSVKDEQIQIVGIVYTILIFTMLWRAVARVEFFNDLWTWTKLSSFVGAAAFVVSDLMLAVNKFVAPLPFADTAIMATYYFAQLGITVSVVDSHVDKVIELSLQMQNQEPRETCNRETNGEAVQVIE